MACEALSRTARPDQTLNFSTMRNLFLPSLLMLLTSMAFAQVPNGSFENWTSFGSYEDPTGWESTNLYFPYSGVVVCEKDTDCTEGQYAALLTTKYSSMMAETMPGWLFQNGFAYNHRPEKLKFDYKLWLNTGDPAAVFRVTLTKWDSSSNSSITIAEVFEILSVSVSSWTEAEYSFDYSSHLQPDSCFMIFASGDEMTCVDSSYIKIDKVVLDGTYVGIAGEEIHPAFRISPNPASDVLYIDLAMNEQSLSITDLSGRVILNRDGLSASSRHKVDISSLPAGIYIVRVSGENDTSTGKFVKYQE